MSDNMATLRTIGAGERVGEEIKAFRAAAVTSENRATPLARTLLAALVAGTTTPALIVSTVIASFGNPKSEKGKALDKLSGSGDYLPGWSRTRMTIADVFGIFENIDADAPQTVGEGDDTRIVGTGDIRRMTVAFILNEPSAHRNLFALKKAVKAALSAHAATLTPDVGDGAPDADQAAADAANTPPAMSLSERANALIVAYKAAPVADRIAAQDALTALFLAVDGDDLGTADEVQEPVVPTALEPAE